VKLIAAELTGFKRFEQTAKINLDGKLIALVGPNEAGKTSILAAFERFGSGEGIPRSEWTRATSPGPEDVAVETLWLLEPDDLADVVVPPGEEAPRWLTRKKLFGGGRPVEVSPALHRPKDPRRRARDELERLRKGRWITEAEEPPFDIDELDALTRELASDEETLPPHIREHITVFADLLGNAVTSNEAAPAYAQELVQRLRNLREHEDDIHPNDAAIDELEPLIPSFLPFTDIERTLDSAYELVDVAFDPPAALGNLAALAGLQLGSLLEAIQAGDLGHAEDMLLAANERLAKELNRVWGQSEIEPRLTHDGTVFRIFVRTDKGGFLDIAQRSDGLRTFMALVAFTARHGGARRPILSIDEAEQHLHYDAQADLTQMLARQEQAAQVIYTSHSAGCLPQDLGTGVRLVTPSEGVDRSSVENWPWAEGVGFSPLLLGMGASTLAFVPTRAAVVGEGGTEVILLPTLLREVTGLADVPFQVAPGSAEASKEAIAQLDFRGQQGRLLG
jgi:AAA domain, putative AbiEii toxin, Type IV TA system/AAA ATPase domain